MIACTADNFERLDIAIERLQTSRKAPEIPTKWLPGEVHGTFTVRRGEPSFAVYLRN